MRFSPASLVAGILAGGFSIQAQLLVTFEDLALPPALDSTKPLQEASGTGPLYSGIVWDSRVNVGGRDYRVDPVTPGPRFGIPRSGDFYISNEATALAGQGITLTTTLV